jgi:hypothetical protein
MRIINDSIDEEKLNMFQKKYPFSMILCLLTITLSGSLWAQKIEGEGEGTDPGGTTQTTELTRAGVDQSPIPRNLPRGNNALISQAPDQVNGLFSDTDCDFCGSGVQSIAENFTLTDTANIAQLVFWGAYFPNNIPATDSFTVIFHSNGASLPGGTVSTEGGLSPTTRTLTGITLFGVNEYEYVLDITPVTLGPGTYWVELYNNTSTSAESWFWETGTLDPSAGIAGAAFDAATPGAAWGPITGNDMALQMFRICELTGIDFDGSSTLTVTGDCLDGVDVYFVDRSGDTTLLVSSVPISGATSISVPFVRDSFYLAVEAGGDPADLGLVRIITQVATVPTLGEWGLIGFVSLLGVAALFFLRRRRLA